MRQRSGVDGYHDGSANAAVKPTFARKERGNADCAAIATARLRFTRLKMNPRHPGRSLRSHMCTFLLGEPDPPSLIPVLQPDLSSAFAPRPSVGGLRGDIANFGQLLGEFDRSMRDQSRPTWALHRCRARSRAWRRLLVPDRPAPQPSRRAACAHPQGIGHSLQACPPGRRYAKLRQAVWPSCTGPRATMSFMFINLALISEALI